MERRALFGMYVAELTALMTSLGQPGYRAAQVAAGLYRQRAATLDEMTTLPLALREQLAAAGYGVGLPVLAQTAKSVDGTERYLVELADGETVETVWMPDGDGAEEDEATADSTASLRNDNKGMEHNNKGVERGGSQGSAAPRTHRGETAMHGARVREFRRATICISSQVGCAVNCQFCLTAKLGIRRNLTAGEIAGQVAAVLTRHEIAVGSAKGQGNPDRINLVFMGMGEPFLNYEEFMRAFRLLSEQMGIAPSRMTVSTSGIEPAIRRFAEESSRPKLALSLNASNDTVRGEIMPITRKWNIAALLDAVKTIPLGKREYVTFEYVLLGGVNDQPEHAREVLALLKGMQAKVNLIVWNPGPGIAYKQPTPEAADRFHKMLIAGGIPTFTRRPRGRDIYAACGQLKRTVEDPLPFASSLVEIQAFP